MSDEPYTVKKFSELTVEELYDILRLRSEIFVVEQQCIYQDMDGKDGLALHLFERDPSNGLLIAYCRIFGPGAMHPEHSSIGRVVVKKEYRGAGVATKLMNHAIDYTKRSFPNFPIKISAQNYLLDFYTSLSFRPVGDSYLEDGIPHTAMILD